MTDLEALKQELAQECVRCVNSFTGQPMLKASGHALKCSLRTCNRKRHKLKMAELKKMEKGER